LQLNLKKDHLKTGDRVASEKPVSGAPALASLTGRYGGGVTFFRLCSNRERNLENNYFFH
jgi:hypothetical protein